MKIAFKLATYGFYDYSLNNDKGFEVPKCRVCGNYMLPNKLKHDSLWMYCQDHEDEAKIYFDGRIEYWLDRETLFKIESEIGGNNGIR